MKNNLKQNSIKYYWGNTFLEFFPSRALFNHGSKELLICDIHLGKAEYFQLNGIPLTNNEDESNLSRISKIIKKLKPEKLVILGDLFHSKYSLSERLIMKLESILDLHNIEIELVEGNHDRGCIVKSFLYLKHKKYLNLIYSHQPIRHKEKNVLNICGHYHPKLYLKNSHDKLSLRCFAFDFKNNILYLPAFGDLTGGHLCKEEFKKWAIIDDDWIIEV